MAVDDVDAAPDDEVQAIRRATAWCRTKHVTALRLSGGGAYAALDRLVPRELFVRDGAALQTVLLDDDAVVIADLYVARDGDDFLLFCEGPTTAELTALIAATGVTDVVVVDVADRHEIVSVHGPYAWELLGEVFGLEVVGAPYLTLFRAPFGDVEQLCLRAGKTGEYGYDVVVDKGLVAAFIDALVAAGQRFDLREVGLAALDQCALENWFFNVRREGRYGLTPMELQLQWRVSFRKPSFVGAEALRAFKQDQQNGRRITAIVADEALVLGDKIVHGDDDVGVIVAAGASVIRGDVVGLALLDVALAWPHLNVLDVIDPRDRRTALHTVCPPVLFNLSLQVKPQRHSYATRADDTFLPLAIPRRGARDQR